VRVIVLGAQPTAPAAERWLLPSVTMLMISPFLKSSSTGFPFGRRR
jgi:hypothetical protein